MRLVILQPLKFAFIIIIAEDPRFCKRRDECDSIFKKYANIYMLFSNIYGIINSERLLRSH